MDHRDIQVKGLERYIPSPLSKTLLVAVLTVPVALFASLTQLHEHVFSGDSVEVVTVKALICSLGVGFFLTLFLVVNLSVIIYQSKHTRIVHYSLMHPQMSFRWLWENSTTKHYLFIVSIFIAGVFAGLYVIP